MRKKRNEENYRETRAADGGYSPHISKETAERIARYCKLTNQNRTKFIEKCINERLDVLEDEYLTTLSKEELIKLIKRK